MRSPRSSAQKASCGALSTKAPSASQPQRCHSSTATADVSAITMNVERESRGLAADEDRGRERAEDAERRDELGVPADGDGGPDGADEPGDEQAGRGRDHVLDGGRVGQRRVQAGDRRGDGGERRVGLVAPLVQEEPDREEQGRAEERERDPRLDADPAPVDGDDEEEDDPDDDRETADPREDAPAEEVLERLVGPPRLGRRAVAGVAAVSGRGGGICGGGVASAAGVSAAGGGAGRCAGGAPAGAPRTSSSVTRTTRVRTSASRTPIRSSSDRSGSMPASYFASAHKVLKRISVFT